MRSQFLAFALTTTCLAATPVYADITAEQAWQSYQDVMSRVGMRPSADVSREGDTLVVRNMVYALEMKDAGISSVSTAPEIRFQERSGGTVAIRFMEPLQTIVTAPIDPTFSEETIETHSSMTYKGELIVSGSVEDQLYTSENMSLVMENQPVIMDGKTIQPGLTMTMDGINGTYSLTQAGEALNSEIDMTATSLRYDIDPVENEDGSAEIGFAANGLGVTGTALFPQTDAEDGFAQFLKQGNVDMQMRFADSALAAKIVGDMPENAMNISATTGATTLDIDIHEGAVGYDTATQNVDLTVAGAQIPGGAAKITMREYSGGILIPLAASDVAQPFKLSIGLEDLVLPDIAWMIADPAGQIPHDPATLRLAFDGTLQSDVDLFDAKALAELENSGSGMPFQLQTLNLPELYLALAGASIKGNGAGHFLDQEPATPGGMPPFAGTLSLNLKGITALIDKLTSAGILPPEQAMTAQMMLGLFARPGDTPDELVSEIEMTEDGAIIANGQPLPF